MNIVPVTPDRFPDLARLFGPNGANSGCWCMWWRIPAKDWTAAGNAGNRAALAAAVDRGEPVGLLAYEADDPVGWTAVAPRAAYHRLLRSQTLRLAPADEPGVWSVTCFYIHRRHRRGGVAAALLDAAVAHARVQGATAVEGYPVDTGGDRRPSGDLFTGTVPLFTRAGFREHTRPPTGKRIVVRLSL
jgi:GNAT superfamily N-acetyltransferase